MTDSQRIAIKLSEARQKINELSAQEETEGATEARTAELVTLRTTSITLESEYRTAVTKEGDDATTNTTTTEVDTEERERRELREKASLADYLGAALTGTAPAGAAAEYADSMGCPGLVPITMLGATTEARQREHREREQRVVTPAPADVDVPHTHAPIVPALFDRSVAPYLGVEMPTVGTGIASYPVLHTSLTAGMAAEDGAAVSTAGSFDVTNADPRRLSGAMQVRREDIAKLPNLESALQMNLSQVLSDVLDGQLLNGGGVAPALNGIIAQLTAAPAPAADVETYARYQVAFSEHIDGLFAAGPMDVRALVGVATLRHMLGVYRANEDVTTAYDLIQRVYGGVRTTRRVTAPSSGIQNAVMRRANPAGDRVAVAPIWQGFEVIRDIYGDNASTGQVTITATMLIGGVVILRPGVFVLDAFRVA